MVQVGDVVRFKGGATIEQSKWAAADYPSFLIVGRTYVVESVEHETWCTRITLENKQGKFNATNFSVV